jgi:hypothetical protein
VASGGYDYYYCPLPIDRGYNNLMTQTIKHVLNGLASD